MKRGRRRRNETPNQSPPPSRRLSLSLSLCVSIFLPLPPLTAPWCAPRSRAEYASSKEGVAMIREREKAFAKRQIDDDFLSIGVDLACLVISGVGRPRQNRKMKPITRPGALPPPFHSIRCLQSSFLASLSFVFGPFKKEKEKKLKPSPPPPSPRCRRRRPLEPLSFKPLPRRPPSSGPAGLLRPPSWDAPASTSCAASTATSTAARATTSWPGWRRTARGRPSPGGTPWRPAL